MSGSKRIPASALAFLSVVVGLSLLGFHAYRGLETTRSLAGSESTTAAAAAAREFACLESSLRSVVPPGASVFVAIADSLWYQRTVAAAFPDRQVVADRGVADFVVTFRFPSAPAPCKAGVFEITRGQAS